MNSLIQYVYNGQDVYLMVAVCVVRLLCTTGEEGELELWFAQWVRRAGRSGTPTLQYFCKAKVFDILLLKHP